MVAPRVTKRVSLSIKPPISVEQLQKEGGAQDCSLGYWPINLSFICLLYLIILKTIRVMNSIFFYSYNFRGQMNGNAASALLITDHNSQNMENISDKLHCSYEVKCVYP